ncbi:RNA polymerase sigma factor [Nocardia brasiliensis]|uniref:RNA polymerase sigma factor n=1 Tax=Nocardia brasiliensis TaxID=37326 RepID=UPI00367225AC
MTDESDQISTADVRVPPVHLFTKAAQDSLYREQFSAFYREFLPNLVAFLIHHGARPVDATDIAQDTMTKAWQNWSAIQTPKAWTRLVASRELVRRIARIQKDQIAESEHSALLPTNSDLDEWVEQHHYHRALSALPPRQRQVMIWTMEGYKPAEIAERLQLDPATVRSNLRTARRAIVTHLNRSAPQ